MQMGGNVCVTDAKKDPPIVRWQGHQFQKTGIPRLYRSEMPDLEREALETEASTHKQTTLTLLKDKAESHGGFCGIGEKSTCKNLKSRLCALVF